MISPGIKPSLQLIDEGFSRLNAKVINDDYFLASVAAPPLVIFFKISIRVEVPGLTGFTSASVSIIPFNDFRVGTRGNFDIIFLISTDVTIMTKEYIWLNLGFSTSNNKISNFLPVSLRVALEGLFTEFPGAINTGLFFKAVGGGTIIFSD